MKTLESMTPSQYLDHMWLEYEKSTDGTTELYRWNEGSSSLDTVPTYLSTYDRFGRQNALRSARKEFTGLEAVWRNIIPKSLLSTMPVHERSLCDSLLVSLFPTYSIDSKFARTPRGDRLVLVHIGISPYLSRLLIPFVKAFTGQQIKERDQIEMLKDISMHWLVGHPIGVEKPTTNAEALVHAYLFGACQQFIVGHEFGHAVLGHVSYKSDQNANHKMEYEADEYGARLLFELMARGIDSEGEAGRSTECYGLIAPAIVLGGFSIFDKSATATHPAPLDRMMTFIENYQNYIPSEQTWPKSHLDLALQNVVAVAQAFYKWAEDEVF